ncbi:MAG: iron complex outermembrane receptor protein [Candidatus Azotimanducaceae bacterium]|jgi:iron complex outermembrane receptor protein
MASRYSGLQTAFVAAALLLPTYSFAASSKRQIEEVIVTAERQESSVQDTSISITAFTADTIDDFGIRNQSDLQNLVPATIILPYDASVRGVGRNFRALGGDPGVATYMNNVYSEDLYTATIGSLWDVQRVEVLRGPQGTLYGRNAIGGAINFLYKKPTDEFEGAVKATLGTYGTTDAFGMVSGTLIPDVLTGRATVSSRKHDGYFEERGTGADLDSGDEINVALQLEWRVNDAIKLNVRSNKASVDRTFGGADGGGLIVFRGESPNGESRDLSSAGFGYRAIDRTVTDPLSEAFYVSSQPIYTFNDPVNGGTLDAQKTRPGVDPVRALGGTAISSAGSLINHASGSSAAANECLFTDLDDISGSDICAVTNGNSYELFDQDGTQFEAEWEVSDSIVLKYIYGLNDLLYERVTDDDSSYNTASDRQFYVNHEAEYQSHEFQAFVDVTDSISFTSGIFFYDATIDQRGDFYSDAQASQFTDSHPISMAVYAAIDGLAGVFQAEQTGLYTAREAAGGDNAPYFQQVAKIGAWTGDPGGIGLDVLHGPDQIASDLLYATQTVRESFAAYTQAVWDINEDFTLTAGLRYASDKVEAEENLWRYRENDAGFANPFGSSASPLAALNIARGALDPVTLQPTGTTHLNLGGVPSSLSVFRRLQRKDTKVTWRVNLDWAMTDNILWYGNVTTGYRGGGYNLVFFSQTATYGPEELIAYEIGYKGQHLDNTLQVNASAFLYDYTQIHTSGSEATTLGGVTTSILPAPGAEVKGFEVEVLWLATDSVTLGGNYSYTPSKFNESLLLANTNDPRIPPSLFSAVDIRNDVNGNQLPNVAENKGTVYASYGFPFSTGNMELLVNYSWVDGVFHTPFADSFDATPGYERVDLRATWKNDDENIIVAGFVNNLLDEIGIRQLETHGESEGFRRTGQVTEPRVVGVEVTYKFN